MAKGAQKFTNNSTNTGPGEVSDECLPRLWMADGLMGPKNEGDSGNCDTANKHKQTARKAWRLSKSPRASYGMQFRPYERILIRSSCQF